MRSPVARRGFLWSAASLLRLTAQETTFSADVNVVSVLATVRNKRGEIIRNLTKDDFVLEEDGRPQTIRYFSQQSGLPLTLGLLVDTSMSQRRVLEEERTASYRFLEQVLREDKDLAFVIRFDREVELLQDFTASRKKLEEALILLKTPNTMRWGGPGGARRRFPSPGSPPSRSRGAAGTSLYDSILLASDELMKKQSGRKAFIMLSDGVDMGSKVSINDAIESAQRADTLTYTIRFYDKDQYAARVRRRPGSRVPTTRVDGKDALERIAVETGGGYFDVSRKLPLDRIFKQIEEELRNQYNLGYTSDKPNGSGEFRKIRVTTKQKGLIVQSRSGYYATR